MCEHDNATSITFKNTTADVVGWLLLLRLTEFVTRQVTLKWDLTSDASTTIVTTNNCFSSVNRSHSFLWFFLHRFIHFVSPRLLRPSVFPSSQRSHSATFLRFGLERLTWVNRIIRFSLIKSIVSFSTAVRCLISSLGTLSPRVSLVLRLCYNDFTSDQ